MAEIASKRAKPTGLLCPACKTKFHNVYKTIQKHGSVARYRKCFNGHSFLTRELVVMD